MSRRLLRQKRLNRSQRQQTPRPEEHGIEGVLGPRYFNQIGSIAVGLQLLMQLSCEDWFDDVIAAALDEQGRRLSAVRVRHRRGGAIFFGNLCW